jgi:dihydrofolate synthase/folylpolyglutamate synthase
MNEELQDMRKLASRFDNPQNTLKVIHVAGTNGKGSVSMKVARSLEKMGYKTGLFTSPHIIDFTERV